MVTQVQHRLPWLSLPLDDPETLWGREWLVANGLGGYASGTVAGACTRRYHGLLVAALPAPLGRMLMFNHLAEEMHLEDQRLLRLDAEDRNGGEAASEAKNLHEFRLENGLPVWRFEQPPFVLEKRLLLPYLQNTVLITYSLLEAPAGQRVRLRLRPSFHFRPHDACVSGQSPSPYSVHARDGRFEIQSEAAPPLRMYLTGPGSRLVLDGGRFRQIQYRTEQSRGYAYVGEVWNPGYFRTDLVAGQDATLAASTESWETFLAVSPESAREAEHQRRARLIDSAPSCAQSGLGGELVLAADQFIIRPSTRLADATLAHAAGDDARTIIAGYHWFTDWGRDTMISLEGLTLTTGRHAEGGYLLRTFGRHVRHGLIPNLFPEGQNEGLYHTADATLWYFHALHRYLLATNDRQTLRSLLPTLRDIVDHHLRGTDFGIRVDPSDGLLMQGAAGYQLTWMDAKVDGWVVTPRRGKAVEINALWYNALRLLSGWLLEENDAAAAEQLAGHAEQAQRSFQRRFWREDLQYLLDVVDGEQGDDGALRPNQLLAISLDHPVLDPRHWRAVVDRVSEELLTPFGLRTLARGHRDYKATYDGDLRARDAAYHQGTVWAWLIGPFIDAWLRVHPQETAAARQLLQGFESHLAQGCVGSISEIFDAEAPYRPRGCIAQAWSVAEVLRCWVKTDSNVAESACRE